jgi:hypothetical protein
VVDFGLRSRGARKIRVCSIYDACSGGSLNGGAVSPRGVCVCIFYAHIIIYNITS